jgi:hypothetical protein
LLRFLLLCLIVLLNKLHIPRELFVVFAQPTGESAISGRADQKLELKMAHEHDHHTAKDSKKDVEIPDLFGIDALDIHGGEPCLVQGAKMAATSFIAGSFFGGVLVYWKDVGVVQKRGRFAALQGTLKSIGSYGAFFALVGATYGTAFCALQHSRTKNDPFTTVLASCAAGGVIGARGTPPSPFQPSHCFESSLSSPPMNNNFLFF